MIIYSYIGNTYLPMLLAPFSTTLHHIPPPPPLPPTQKKNFFLFQIWILCQNSLTRELKIRVVGFVLKKLLTFFENLIVPHALHCINGCFLVTSLCLLSVVRALSTFCFKRLLLQNRWTDFKIISQAGSLGDPLPKLLKVFGFVEQYGRQS